MQLFVSAVWVPCARVGLIAFHGNAAVCIGSVGAVCTCRPLRIAAVVTVPVAIIVVPSSSEDRGECFRFDFCPNKGRTSLKSSLSPL